MSASLDGKPTKRRKKVRKGTHSCWECRRRKVRCLFAQAEHSVCITCTQRGSKCVSQVDSDGPDTSFGQSSSISRLVEPNSQLFNNSSGTNATALQHESAPLSRSTTPAVTVNGSTAAYLDDGRTDEGYGHSQHRMANAINMPPTPASNSVSPSEVRNYSTVRAALLSALPCQSDIKILLNKAPNFHSINHKPCGSSTTGVRPTSTLPTLLYPETHPVLLASQMLHFAAALQHLSRRDSIGGLSQHHHVTMNALLEAAKTVTTNDAYLGTLEGLENIVLEGNLYIDSGNIRQAWIALRRGVTAAQLLGLHRPGHYRFKVINVQRTPDPVEMWTEIVCMERVLSLLLGLPTSTGTVKVAQPSGSSSRTHGYDLSSFLGGATAKILERNQIDKSQQAKDLTREIDRELVELAGQLHPAFWRPTAFEGLEQESEDAFNETRRAFSHMCYYTLVIQLHLPHMLCPEDASQRTYSKIACVNASREILTREIAMRTFNPSTACCRTSDFLALIAGLTLMLAHATSHCGEENLLIHQRLGDRATVERALECMKSMSELHEDVLAVKCAAVLKDLLAIEAEAAHGAKNKGDLEQEDDRNMLIMNVPYVGSIRISRKGITAVAPPAIEQDHRLQESITIGGMGSVHVSTPSSMDQRMINHAADAATQRDEAAPAANALTIEQQSSYGAPATSDDLFMQHHRDMFPDPAAGLDDWV